MTWFHLPSPVTLSSPERASTYWERIETLVQGGGVGPQDLHPLLLCAAGGVARGVDPRDLGGGGPPSLPALHALLRHGADPNHVNDCFLTRADTPLGWAVGQPDARLCRALLDAGADPNAPAAWESLAANFAQDVDYLAVGGNGRPLCRAATPDIAHMLLAAGADPTVPCTLFSPAARRDPALCRALVGLGADPGPGSGSTHWGHTPLFVAHSPGVAEVLLETGRYTVDDITAALVVHATERKRAPGDQGAADVCRVLLAAGARVQDVHLSSVDCVQVLEVLVAAGAPVTAVAGGPSPLCSPQASRDVGACRLLLAAGADPNASGDAMPLHCARTYDVF
jgi:hypothetical protein